MKLTQKQKLQYHTDGICRVFEIKQHLIKHDIREALLKHAPFNVLGQSEQYPSEVFADAYVSAIEAGDLEPIVFNENYNDMVHRTEHEAMVRRLQSDDTVMTLSQKPFSSFDKAKKFQAKYDLEITHDVERIKGGFMLKRSPPSKQQEKKDRINGIHSYDQLMKQVFIELGLDYQKTNADGEIDATDAQWAVIDQRINNLQSAQYRLNRNTSQTLQKLALEFHSDQGMISRDYLLLSGDFEKHASTLIEHFLVYVERDGLYDVAKIIADLATNNEAQESHLLFTLKNFSELKKVA